MPFQVPPFLWSLRPDNAHTVFTITFVFISSIVNIKLCSSNEKYSYLFRCTEEEKKKLKKRTHRLFFSVPSFRTADCGIHSGDKWKRAQREKRNEMRRKKKTRSTHLNYVVVVLLKFFSHFFLPRFN